MHPEQEAFEKGIDANPLESSNHLVYADWLDENGQPKEAALRRRIGRFIAANPRPDFDYAISELPSHVVHYWYPFGSRNLGAEHYYHPPGKSRLRFNSYRDMEHAFRQPMQPEPEQLSRRAVALRRMRRTGNRG